MVNMIPMIERPFWTQRIYHAWEHRPIVWLSGVRRAGKTTLAQNVLRSSLSKLRSAIGRTATIRSRKLFYDSLDKGNIVIFDEIHRLEDPSRLLKIAADAYPHLKVLATGSSTLAATKKFRDTLTGRKHTIYLSPVLWTECTDTFNNKATSSSITAWRTAGTLAFKDERCGLFLGMDG